MFKNNVAFNQPLNSWDVSSVEKMDYMFAAATAFNQPLNSWDVSNVSSFLDMFAFASNFNQPLNNWDVSNVTNAVSGFLYSAGAFSQDLSMWCFHSDLWPAINSYFWGGTQMAVAQRPKQYGDCSPSMFATVGNFQTAPAGTTLDTQPGVLVRNEDYDPVPGVEVTFAVASGGGTVDPVGAVSTDANGVAAVTSWTLGTTEGSNSLTASAPGITAVTFTATGTAVAATQLAVATAPVAGANGAVLGTQPIVEIQDAQGNVVTGDSTTEVAVSISGGSGGTLGGTVSVQAVNGVVTFSDLTLTGSTSETYTLSFVDTGAAFTAVTSNVSLSGAGSATQLVVATAPGAGANGAVLGTQPIVEIQDAQGNVVTGDSTTEVAVSISGGSGGTLGGTVSVQAVNGVVTFSDVTLTGLTSETYTLSFVDTGAAFTAVTSNVSLSGAGSATQLVVATAPGAGANGAVLGTQPIVEIQDAQGNVVTGDSTTEVAVSISGGSGGTLGGTVSVQAVNGVVTFSDLTLTGSTSETYTLSFVDTGAAFTAVTSNVTLSGSGSATQLAVATTQPIVEIQDAQGNVVTGDSTTEVAVSISGGSGGTLGGTVSVQAVNGVVTFSDLTLTGSTSETYTLSFVDTGAAFTAVTSNVTLSGSQCYDAANVGQVGQVGWTGCEGMLIVNNAALNAAASSAVGGNSTFAILGPGGNTYTFADSTHNIFTGQVNSLNKTFFGTLFNGDINYWDVSNVTDMGAAFDGSKFNQPLNNWDVSNVTTMDAMFRASPFNQPLDNWDVSNVTNMRAMFYFASSFNQPLANWNVSNVTTMYNMFWGAIVFNQPLANWDVSNVTNMRAMFHFATSFRQPLDNWDVSNVTDMQYMFARARSFNQPLDNWDVSNVTTMDTMFRASPFNQPLDNWDVSNVTTMDRMFESATAFNQDLSDWCVTNIPSKPISFDTGASAWNKPLPIWGSCLATQLAVVTPPAAGANGAVLGTQPIVQIQNAQGNVVTGDSTTAVEVSISGGSGGTLGGTTTVTAVNGVVTFTDLMLSGATSETYTLSFVDTGAAFTAVTSNVSLTPVLSVATAPAAGANGAVLGMQPVIELRDAQGNVVTGDNTTEVAVSISGGYGGALGGTVSVQAVNGVVTFSDLTLTGTVGATYTLRFADTGSAFAPVTSNVSLSGSGSATQLAVATAPAAGANGAVLGTQPIVQIQDAQGNVVTGDSTTEVAVSISGGSGGTLGGTATVTASSGVVTFTDLTLTGSTSETYTLSFVDTGAAFTAVTSNVTLSGSGSATQLAVATAPVAGANGAVLGTQPIVEIQDAQGNVVTGDSTTEVAVSISGGSGGTLGGTVSVQAVNGVVTFSDLTLTGSTSETYTLSFVDTGAAFTAVTSNVSLTPVLSVATAPAAGANGAVLGMQPVIELRDAQGNVVTGDNTTEVAVSISGGYGGALGGTVSVQAVNGVVTFSDLTLTGSTSETYTLSFVDTGAAFTAVTSNVTLSGSGSATQLAVATAPVTGANGAVLWIQPIVEIQDAQGNVVTGDSTTEVAVSISGGSGGTLGGTVSVQAVNGVVTFSDVTLTGLTSETYTLSFVDTGAAFTAVTSNVSLSGAGSATQLVVATAPGAGANGAVLGTQPIVEIQDAQGNVVTGDSTTEVAVSISGGSGGTLGGTVSVQAVNGVVTFSDVTLTGLTSETYTLSFVDTGAAFTAVTSNVSLSGAGSATQLVVATAPGAGANGAVLGTQPIVEIQDAQGNVVTGDSTTEVAVSISGGSGGTLGGTVSVQAVNGVVTFSDVTLTGLTSETYTLSFVDTGAAFTAVTSNVSLSGAGSATQLVVATAPGAGANGAVLGTQPIVEIQDAQGNVVTGDSTTEVAVSISGGSGGTLGGTVSVQAVNGVVTFSDVTLTGLTSETYTLSFVDTGAAFTAVTSNVSLSGAGSATQLVVATAPGAGANGAVLGTQPIVEIQDAQGNVVTGDSTTEVAVSISGGSGGTLGGTVSVQAVNGVVTFSDVTLTGLTSETYTLSFVDTGAAFTAVTSNVSLSGAGSATQLVVATAPGAGANGAVLGTQPIVEIQDAQGNVVTGDSTTEVAVSISGGSGGTLGGTVSVQAVNGVVTFSDVTLTGLTSETYTLSFVDTGAAFTAVTSNVSLSGAGSATQLVVATAPGAGANGAVLGTQPIVEIQDAQGNVVTGDSTTEVAVSISGGSGGTLGGTVSVQAVNGVVTFSDVTLTGLTSETYTLSFVDTGAAFTAVTSNVSLSGAGSATQLVVATAPGAGANGAVLGTQPIVEIQDAQGNVVTGDSTTEVAVSISGGSGGTLGGTVSVQAVNGVVTFSDVTLTGLTSETYTLSFVDTGAAFTAVTSNVSLSGAGSATQLVVATAPGAGANGAVLGTQPIVEIQDAQGNVVTGDSTTEVAVSISGGSGGTLGGTVSVQAVNGVVTFSDVTLTGLTSETYTLSFVDTGAAFTAVTSNVSLSGAGSATQLVVATAPGAGANGAVLGTQPIVEIQDAQGNVVTGDSTTEVAVSISGGSGGTLGGTVSVQAVNGVVTFSDVTLTGLTSETYTLSFVDTGAAFTAVTSNVSLSGAGSATQLVVATAPGAGANGAVLGTQPIVEIQDAQGNVVTGDSTTEVAVSISGGSGGTLGGTVSVQAVNGVVTFSDVTLTGLTSETYTLSFVDTGAAFTAVTSNVSLSGAGSATQLVVATAPGAGANGAVLGTQPIVEIQDAQGNVVTGDSTTEVAVSISGGSGGTLGGTVSVQAVNGVVTFSDVTLTGLTSETYTLSFVDTGAAFTAVTSNVSLSGAGSATQLVVATAPGAGANGAVLGTQPIVEIQDAQGNVVTGDSTTEVAVSISGGSGGTLGGTVSVQAVNGVVTFSDVTLTGLTSETYTLSFVDTGAAFTAVTSNVSLSGAGSATQLVVATAPGAGANGAVLGTQPIVEIQDAQGNVVTGDSTTEVAVSISGGSGGTLGGTVSVQAVNGVVTFSDVTLTGLTSETYTLSFVDTGAAFTAVTSNVSLSGAGSATQLVVATAPGAGANGAVLGTQPIVEIQDAQGNVVTGDSTTEVAVSISGGSGGTLGGTVSVQAVNGVVTFSDVTLTGLTSETYTLSFVDTGAAFTAVTSNVSLSGAGSATQLVVATAPGAGANGAVLGTQPIVEIQDAQGNVVTGDSTTEVAVSISGGSGGTLGGTVSVQAVNGVVTFSDVTLTGLTSETYTLSFVDTGRGVYGGDVECEPVGRGVLRHSWCCDGAWCWCEWGRFWGRSRSWRSRMRRATWSRVTARRRLRYRSVVGPAGRLAGRCRFRR
jgi:surface protein